MIGLFKINFIATFSKNNRLFLEMILLFGNLRWLYLTLNFKEIVNLENLVDKMDLNCLVL